MTDPRAVPAAHSMDTAWFGVDADGNLALFDTGEAGAIPTDAAGLGEYARPLGDHDDGFDAIRRALKIDDEVVYDPDAGELPVFRYQHVEDYYVADRYERASAPKRPGRIEEVPPELRAGIVKLPVRFAAGDPVQPVEHVPAVGWSALWRSVDGKVVRPFRDRVDDAAREWRELEDEDGLAYDPDPGPSRVGEAPPREEPPRARAPQRPSVDPLTATPDELRAALGLPPRASAASKAPARSSDTVDAEAGVADAAADAGRAGPAPRIPAPAADATSGAPAPAKKPWWKLW